MSYMEPTPSGQAKNKEGMDGEEGQKQNRGYLVEDKEWFPEERQVNPLSNGSPALHLCIVLHPSIRLVSPRGGCPTRARPDKRDLSPGTLELW